MSNKSNASVQSMLVRWAELEPERCEYISREKMHPGMPLGVLPFFEVQFSKYQMTVDFDRDGRVAEKTIALLCYAIEAAIIERGGAYIVSYPESEQVAGDDALNLFLVDIWRVGSPVSLNARRCYGATKLEALLSAYVQALEATHD